MDYNEKFKGLLAAIQDAKKGKAEMMVVPSPETLGDDYAELVESMNRIASAGLMLQIVPKNERLPPDYSRN